MSEWGAKQLSLPILIEHPEQSEALQRVFLKEDYLDIQRRLRSVSPENPIVSANYRLHVNGGERWYKATARPLWEGDGDRTGMDGVASIIGKFVDVHEEQLRLDRLKREAKQDSLTGLQNHNAVKKDIATALVLFDLDNFKEANDRYGHLFGDKTLQYVAQKLQSSIRNGDIAARVGGDEFLLFLEYKGDIEPIMRRIFQSVCGTYNGFEISASMGVSLSPENGTQYDELFHAADKALYAAKRKGKNGFLLYNDTMKGFLSVLSPMDH